MIYAIRESYLDSGSIYSKLAVFFLIDLVYTEVCKLLGEHAVATKRKTALALQELDASPSVHPTCAQATPATGKATTQDTSPAPAARAPVRSAQEQAP